LIEKTAILICFGFSGEEKGNENAEEHAAGKKGNA
jgi:hypothetical protein